MLLTLVSLMTLLLPLSPAAQELRRSFESHSYGFEFAWDPALWTIDENATQIGAGEAATEAVVLARGTTTLRVIAEQRGDPDATTCVANEVARLAAVPGTLEIAPISLDEDEVLVGEADGIAYGGYERRLSDDAGADLAPVFFVECRLLPDSGASLLFVVESAPESFADDMAAAGAVNQTLTFDGSSRATPVVEATPLADVDAASFAADVAAITRNPSTTGPGEGALVQQAGEATLVVTGVEAADFYLRVRFQTPAGEAPWDVGVAFRHAADEEYRLVIDSGGGWYLTRGVETDVQTGALGHLVTRPGGVNSLELLARGETGWLRVNDEVIGPLDLSAITTGGPIALGTAFFGDNTTEGAAIAYRALSVWVLDEDMPSDAGATPVSEVAPAVPDAATPAADRGTTPTPAAIPVTREPATATATPERATPELATEPGSVTLAPRNDSGVSGTATLLPFGAQSTVAITITPAMTAPIAAIHIGTCANFAPVPEHALAVFDAAGQSLSIVPLTAADLATGNRVIVLHASLAEFGEVLACGEIPSTP